jgi:hypothetical protein
VVGAILQQHKAGSSSFSGNASNASAATISAAFAEPLPAFRDVPSSERQELFAKKLRLCCYT